MSPGEYSTLPQAQQIALSNEYLMKQEEKTLQMPTNFLNGDKVPNNSDYFVSFDQYKNEIAERYGFDSKAQSNLDRVGVDRSDVQPIQPNMSTPGIVRGAESAIDGKVGELNEKEKKLRDDATTKIDYDQDLKPDSKITKTLQDKLGNVDTWFGGDSPKK